MINTQGLQLSYSLSNISNPSDNVFWSQYQNRFECPNLYSSFELSIILMVMEAVVTMLDMNSKFLSLIIRIPMFGYIFDVGLFGYKFDEMESILMENPIKLLIFKFLS